MIETLLALVPTYGLWLVAACVTLSRLALPLPAAIIVMAAGGFASAGDLVYWQLVLVAWGGVVVGDQVAYALARRAGPPLIARLRRRRRSASVVDLAERLIGRFGVAAVFISRTVFSTLGPYVSFLCGALRFGWGRYSAVGTLGALCWSLAYSGIGHAFTGRIAEIAPLIGDSIGLIVAGSVAAAVAWWLVRVRKTASGRAAAREPLAESAVGGEDG